MNPIFVKKRAATLLGPSQVSAVIGCDPFMDAGTLKDRMENGYIQQQTTALQRGVQYESLLLSLYSHLCGLKPLKARFAIDPAMPRFGGIADALISKDGGVEIKCCNGTPKVYDTYRIQAVCYMFLYQRGWWDIMVANPDTKENIVERLYWKDYAEQWSDSWYPQIRTFIATVKWARPLWEPRT